MKKNKYIYFFIKRNLSAVPNKVLAEKVSEYQARRLIYLIKRKGHYGKSSGEGGNPTRGHHHSSLSYGPSPAVIPGSCPFSHPPARPFILLRCIYIYIPALPSFSPVTTPLRELAPFPSSHRNPSLRSLLPHFLPPLRGSHEGEGESNGAHH